MGPEGSTLMSLTIVVEQLAEELGEPGASQRDLADTLELLRGLNSTGRQELSETRRLWIPYLEGRVIPDDVVH